LLPFASIEEQEKVRRTALQWRATLDAIPKDALGKDGQSRLHELTEVADGLSRPDSGDSVSLGRIGALGALDAALWRVEASRDAIDARVASAQWSDRMALVIRALALRQAQDDAVRG
jgi:hypothetical protein